MKALDFVRTPKGALAIIQETNDHGKQASIEYIGRCETGEHNAWWDADDLTVIDSLPHLLARCVAHPFGKGALDITDSDVRKPGWGGRVV